MVSTTGSACRLTVGCAGMQPQIDPVPQTDYYAMKACLAGVNGERKLRTDLWNASKTDQSRKKLAAVETALTRFEPLADRRILTFEAEPVFGSLSHPFAKTDRPGQISRGHRSRRRDDPGDVSRLQFLPQLPGLEQCRKHGCLRQRAERGWKIPHLALVGVWFRPTPGMPIFISIRMATSPPPTINPNWPASMSNTSPMALASLNRPTGSGAVFMMEAFGIWRSRARSCCALEQPSCRHSRRAGLVRKGAGCWPPTSPSGRKAPVPPPDIQRPAATRRVTHESARLAGFVPSTRAANFLRAPVSARQNVERFAPVSAGTFLHRRAHRR